MTTENSICIKCRRLYAYSNVCIGKDGTRSLISRCPYGGKNAGNRKKCIDFVEADEKTISERLKNFKE